MPSTWPSISYHLMHVLCKSVSICALFNFINSILKTLFKIIFWFQNQSNLNQSSNKWLDCFLFLLFSFIFCYFVLARVIHFLEDLPVGYTRRFYVPLSPLIVIIITHISTTKIYDHDEFIKRTEKNEYQTFIIKQSSNFIVWKIFFVFKLWVTFIVLIFYPHSATYF